jgi:opacity protein-like surface antigen
MNKLLLLLAALTLMLSIPATAQTASTGSNHPATADFSRWSLSLETGPSFAAGAFSSKNYFRSNAGFARTGFGADLAATYRFCPSFGLTMSAGFQDNPTGTTTHFVEYPGPFEDELLSKRNAWKTHRLLAGAVYERALSKNNRLTLRIRGMAGVLKTEIPGSTTYSVGQSGSKVLEEAWQYSKLTPGFCYQADAGVKYRIRHGLSVLVDAGYTGSKFNGSYSFVIINPDGSGFLTGKTSKPIALGTIQCRAGVEIGL